MTLYANILRPSLLAMCGGNVELVHDLTLGMLQKPWVQRALARHIPVIQDSMLAQTFFDQEYLSPVGLAPGMDKGAVALRAWPHFGFGYMEIGGVVPEPQPGNPKPRMHSLPSGVLINAMGFNSPGMQKVGQNMGRAGNIGQPLWINLAVNKKNGTDPEGTMADYQKCMERLWMYADVWVFNISSPNTRGLRDQWRHVLQNIGALVEVRDRIGREHNLSRVTPMLVKLSPDMPQEDVDTALEFIQESGLDGVVATNTTMSRDGLEVQTELVGGMSGPPLFEKARDLVGYIRTQCPDMFIVGVGGITTADNAIEMLRAGANLLQIYTGFVTQGPMSIVRINSGILQRMDREGMSKIADFHQ